MQFFLKNSAPDATEIKKITWSSVKKKKKTLKIADFKMQIT
jgi:hypothetical protein